VIAGFTEPSHLQCSRAGCTRDAQCRVSWRNPKIHGNDRVKVWLACTEHSVYLQSYLDQRGFPAVITPYDLEVDADQLSQVAQQEPRS
jgi:hypothetical protein